MIGLSSALVQKGTDVNDVFNKGRLIYESIQSILEKNDRGKIVAIDIETKDYFTASTKKEARSRAEAKFAGHSVFFRSIGIDSVVRAPFSSHKGEANARH